MPIYEFKCSRCGHVFELLMMNRGESDDPCCPECRSETFERVLSTTHHAMGGRGETHAASRTRTCSGGSCTSYDIPGPD